MPISDELAQQALDKINELEQALATALAANKALRTDLRKARGGGTSAQERLAELQLRERGEHTEIGLLRDADHRGNPWASPVGEQLIDNLSDPAQLRKATAAAKSRREKKRNR